ncbi:MAG: tRNA uridine-5-carboxymethylaminomethyl(34) synthesis GTPase MnmE [Woeseiaceae bacterium]|nr:tRNA uridine-5-carboxymethylaminomethyl(34) synthesis GTPase MnmE [Woeseiaceae bacterium]
MPEYVRDTIVAAATPPGKGGIGVVRVSGEDAGALAKSLIGKLPEPRVASRATARDSQGNVIDDGLALYFPGPASYTGEPVFEFHGHGGPLVIATLVAAAVELGARRAQPGEFSKRAFLNGKLDLVQAEAIADLIDSGTRQAARAALRSLSGSFSEAVANLERQLVELRMHVEAAIDFPEEEIDFLSDAQLLARIERCTQAFAKLREEAGIGRVLRDGLQLVIVGKPNVGKSSLLNLLSGQEAAIVTEVAGTTRDILRERIEIDGLAVELVDTAGLREDPDRIEAEGIRRAREALGKADGALWIQDANTESPGDLPEDLPADIPVVILRNKIDLTGEPPGIRSDDPKTLNVSVKSGAGIDALRETVRELAGYRDLGEGAFTARKRHVEAIDKAYACFERGKAALEEQKAGELMAEDLRAALDALGEISGAVSSDELLGRIFSEFCIGK